MAEVRAEVVTAPRFFVAQKTLEPFVNNVLIEVAANPIKFKTPRGQVAYGYEATILADICDAILEARKANKLAKQQERIAAKAEILVRGFARVGIIALVVQPSRQAPSVAHRRHRPSGVSSTSARCHNTYACRRQLGTRQTDARHGPPAPWGHAAITAYVADPLDELEWIAGTLRWHRKSCNSST